MKAIYRSPTRKGSEQYSMYIIFVLITIFISCRKLDKKNSETCDGDSNAIVLDSALNNQPKYSELKTYLLKKLSEGQCYTILFQEKESTAVWGGFGWAKCYETFNSNETIFDIASATKMFTAIAILQLMERGQLTLNDNLDLYFNRIQKDKREITIKQLLTHTSGLEMYHDKKGDFEPLTKEKALNRICRQKLQFKPGSKFQYSNSGYTLLAIIIEKVTNKSFDQYIQEHIFGPLDMSNSGFHGCLTYSGRSSKGYGDFKFKNNTPTDWPAPSYALIGNGGAISTANDLLKFHNGLNKLISKQSLDLMTEPVVVNSRYADVFPNCVSQAIALNNYQHPTLGTVLFYGGVNNYGYVSRVRWYKDQNLVIIVLMNNFRNKMESPIISETELNAIEDILL